MDRHLRNTIDAHRHTLRQDFTDGLKCFRKDDFAGALRYFRTADESADIGDIFQGRYTSFHGLSRVMSGDEVGVKLCRKAAAGELSDAEVYYSLALAEYRLHNLERTMTALRRGLRIDPGHTGLLRLKSEMQPRERRGMAPGLMRRHLLERLLGRMLRN